MLNTISKIILRKVFSAIEAQPLAAILMRSLLFFAACTVSLCVLYPLAAQQAFSAITTWHGGAIVKTFFIFVLTFNLSKIGKLAIQSIKNAQKAKEIETADNIEWIPTAELLDHLFQLQTFKREDIEKKFGIPRNRYSTLAARLEAIEVLVRGPNNSRVLNEEYSRADVAAILASAGSSAKNLKQVFRQTSANSWTREPSAKEVMENVIEHIQPSHSPARFQLHRLETAENA